MNKNLLLLVFSLLPVVLWAQNDCQCCAQGQNDFDFWIGEWEVTNPQGKVEGYNTIDKLFDTCILREVFTDAEGTYVGSSNNFYDQELEQWQQIWVYADGRTLFLTGNRIGNQMVLKSPPKKNAAGVIEQDIITWTANANGSVRQLWEHTFDGGNTQIYFDGLYRKKKTD
ncbi:MAG: hypothetical protein ABNH00_07685 [Dokdonia sp.]|jgi:hypothetical protein